MMKKNIAILGTGSEVGKSIIATALCRVLADAGVKVAPFKAQNMSNNSGITPEGLEMGRAQIVQAEAAKLAPHVDMNPVLLKPTGEKKSQVVLNGLVHGNHTALDYHKNKTFYLQKALEAFDRLNNQYERIILEGAGSCAEVNLMPDDIVNFAMAAHANADVILCADIHRGGVFAQIVGTLACLPKKYKDMVKGFIINRFRGDIALFKDGVEWIERKTNRPVLGVLPWYNHFKIDAEDSVEIEECKAAGKLDPDKPAVGIIRLPHIANFTDFHVFSSLNHDIQTVFFDKPEFLPKFQAVIIPGSKNTRADLSWLLPSFKAPLENFIGEGNFLFGICAGYQMLGEYVDDPDGLEGQPGRTPALGLLPVQTTLKSPKTTTLSDFQWEDVTGKGYEIHMGETRVQGGHPLINILSRNSNNCHALDGCMAENRQVAGTYIHGFFDTPEIFKKWLTAAGFEKDLVPENMIRTKEKNYVLLKKHFEAFIDTSYIL